MEDVMQYFGLMFNVRSCPCRNATRIHHTEMKEDMDNYSALYCFDAGVCVQIDFLFQVDVFSLYV